MRRLLPLFSLILFAAAFWVIARELQKYSLAQIADELSRFPSSRLLLSGAITCFCYWTLTGYDALGFRYVRYPMPWRRVTFAAFLAYAYSNNLGMANFAGAAVRYRIYSQWNVSQKTIAEVVGLDVLSNWLGFFTVAGLCFALAPPVLPGLIDLPFVSARPLGIVCLALLATYLVICGWRRRPLTIRGVRLPMPHDRIFLAQIGIACFDFALGGLALYVLLPPDSHISYWEFLSIYLLGQTAGIISHIPGALGVFESVVLTCLSGRIAGPVLFGALIAYRLIYFLLPFIVASALLVAFELRHGFTRRQCGR